MSGMKSDQAMNFQAAALDGMTDAAKDFVTILRGASVASTSGSNIQALLNTNPGVISSSAGMIFEAGGKSAFNSAATATGANFDATSNDAIRKTFGTVTEFADFKISESNDLKQDMATKIMRHRAMEGFMAGFIPNFASFGNRQPSGLDPSVIGVASSVFKGAPQLKEDLGGQTKAVALTKGILKGRGQHLSNTAQRDHGGFLRTSYGKAGGIISGGFIPNFMRWNPFTNPKLGPFHRTDHYRPETHLQPSWMQQKYLDLLKKFPRLKEMLGGGRAKLGPDPYSFQGLRMPLETGILQGMSGHAGNTPISRHIRAGKIALARRIVHPEGRGLGGYLEQGSGLAAIQTSTGRRYDDAEMHLLNQMLGKKAIKTDDTVHKFPFDRKHVGNPKSSMRYVNSPEWANIMFHDVAKTIRYEQSRKQLKGTLVHEVLGHGSLHMLRSAKAARHGGNEADPAAGLRTDAARGNKISENVYNLYNSSAKLKKLGEDLSKGGKDSVAAYMETVSYTHLTLPTTPYV